MSDHITLEFETLHNFLRLIVYILLLSGFPNRKLLLLYIFFYSGSAKVLLLSYITQKCSCSLTWQEKTSARKFIHDNWLHTSSSKKFHLQTTVKTVSHFWQKNVGHYFGNNVCQKICFVNISTHVSNVHPWANSRH